MCFNLLLVDDNALEYELLKARFEVAGRNDVDIHYAPDLAPACEKVARQKFDLLLLDNRLPPIEDFRQSATALRRSGHTGPVIVISACIDSPVFDAAPDFGIDACLSKLDLTTERLQALVDKYSPEMDFTAAGPRAHIA